MKTTGRLQFAKYQGIINILVAIFKPFGKGGNYFLLRFFRNTNGIFGLLLRYIFVKNLAKKVGNNVSIQPNVFLYNLQNIQLGNNVSIHPMCYIEGAGGIDIGDDVSIAHGSSILSTNHQWSNTELAIKYNRESFDKVCIENDVWIGCGVRILSGVTISNRSVVAAGAVVNKSFDKFSLIGGVPAKIIKRTNEN